MKEFTGNIFVHKMKKAQKKKKAKTKICQRAIGADGEPSKFLDAESFWRFCDRNIGGKKHIVEKYEMGISHKTADDCGGCPLAGGKHGVPENMGFIDV